MWKVLLTIAAVVLCGAAYLGYENKKDLEILHADRLQWESDVAALKDDLARTTAELGKEVEITEKLVQETEGLNTRLTVAKGKESEYKTEIEKLKSLVSVAEVELKKGEEFMREVPDIEARKKQMAELQNSIQEAESVTQNLQTQTAEVNTRREKLQGAADELQALTNDQAAGRIRGPFKSTVRKAFNNWGFVIVEGGDEQGVVNRAQLDVTRRGQPICKLLVTTVEPGECVAEIIPGSMAPGQAIHPGDDVTKTELPMPKTPAARDGGAPVSVPTPALPESAPGDMKLPPAGELVPPAPAGEKKEMPAPFGAPAGAETDSFGGEKKKTEAKDGDAKKPNVNSDPFK